MSRIELQDPIAHIKPIDPLNTVGSIEKISPLSKGLGDIPDTMKPAGEINPFSSQALSEKTSTHAQYYLLSLCQKDEELLSFKVRVEKDLSDKFLEELKELDKELAKQGQKLIRNEARAHKLDAVQDFLTIAAHGTSIVLGIAALTSSVVVTTGTGITLSAASIGTLPLITGIGAIVFGGLGLTHLLLQKSGAIHQAATLLPFEEQTQDRIEKITNLGLTATTAIGSLACSGIGLAGGGIKLASLATTGGLQKCASTLVGLVQGTTYGIKGITDVQVTRTEGTFKKIEDTREKTQREYTVALDNVSSAMDADEEFLSSIASGLNKQQERLHALLQQG